MKFLKFQLIKRKIFLFIISSLLLSNFSCKYEHAQEMQIQLAEIRENAEIAVREVKLHHSENKEGCSIAKQLYKNAQLKFNNVINTMNSCLTVNYNKRLIVKSVELANKETKIFVAHVNSLNKTKAVPILPIIIIGVELARAGFELYATYNESNENTKDRLIEQLNNLKFRDFDIIKKN